MRRTKKPRQLALVINSWGGKRKGAGRKPADRPQVAHRPRTAMRRRMPLHVTMRMAPTVYNLRSKRSLRVIEAGLRAGALRENARVVQTSVQGNHLHLVVEADDAKALSRTMQGLAIRLAKGLNKMMKRSGRVFADRFHSRVLRTPTEVRTAMHYLRHNHRHHVGERDQLRDTFVDPYTSDVRLADVLPVPTLWLLREGWKRGLPRGRRA